jgi:hypothetical protein
VVVTLFLPKGIVGTLAGARLPRAAPTGDKEPQRATLRTENA